MVRNNVKEREKRCQGSDSWYQLLFSCSPWLTTLLKSIAGPLIFLLLALTKGPCLLNCLLNYVKERVNSVKLLILRGLYKPLLQDEPTI